MSAPVTSMETKALMLCPISLFSDPDDKLVHFTAIGQLQADVRRAKTVPKGAGAW